MSRLLPNTSDIRLIDSERYPISAQSCITELNENLVGWNGGGLCWQENQLSCLKFLIDNRYGLVRNGILYSNLEIEFSIDWLADKLRNNRFSYGSRISNMRKNQQLRRI